ncbi:4-hydroxythreonine-4-phosphate dehydrogenase PdxA [Zhengella mangrovi]|uniref:4-hydroxythreonine-4-phosphate dehydrogenase PdxA n=1 Tax=Zhengella mangrovi TaxID=1982044 RepID=UPI001FE1139C|nr:4-hydroxythreonine-4-phosphate dehydrogenase PdxA [Zhengella mangrovi]
MKPLAVSGGDPAGIGLEIAARAWLGRQDHALPAFYLIGDSAALGSRARQCGFTLPVKVIGGPEEAPATFSSALPVIEIRSAAPVQAGCPDPAHASMIVGAIDRAVQDTTAGKAAGVVTLPIAKKPLYEAGFSFPGHTEYLASLAEQATGQPVRPVMMLAGPKLRSVPVTIHIALSDVPAALTPDLLEDTLRITARDLQSRFGLARPRLAVAGLNPHAGEGGSMGREEIEVIGPVLDRLRAEGLDIAGPLPADTMFHERARANYDVAVCMYHDQALIPAKALGFDDAVNVTLGLPFIRTSPDHGTAFDIAGKGLARPDSFIAALRMAAEMAAQQGPSA